MIRKKVADKRLRVKGRFVTNDQALKLLGLTNEELQGSQELQQFFNDQASVQFQLDSIFQAQNGQRTHVKNLQVLFEEAGIVKKSNDPNQSSTLRKDGEITSISQQMLSVGMSNESNIPKKFFLFSQLPAV